MKVSLDSKDLILAAHYAGMVQSVKGILNDSNEVKDHKYSSMGGFEIHHIGYLGEIAASKALGFQVGSEITKYGDGGIDAVIAGASIQVKTSVYTGKNQYLFVTDFDKDVIADWLIACTVRSPSVIEIGGFISKRKFKARMFKFNFGYGERDCVKFSDLAPIEKFKEVLETSK